MENTIKNGEKATTDRGGLSVTPIDNSNQLGTRSHPVARRPNGLGEKLRRIAAS